MKVVYILDGVLKEGWIATKYLQKVKDYYKKGNQLDYNDLDEFDKKAVEILGWDEEKWDKGDQRPFNQNWNTFNDKQLTAVKLLGYEEKDFYDLPEDLMQSIVDFMDSSPNDEKIVEFIIENITNNPELTDENREDAKTYLFKAATSLKLSSA